MPGSEDFKGFSEIICQERAIQFLKGVMTRGKIPHAYLFAGIPGIGKTTTAKALTQAINCPKREGGEACGGCPSCHQVRTGSFPDLVFIEPEGQNIKIEQIRNLNRTLSFRPMAGKYRVSIIRQAEGMTDEAANALLKSLEEPPPSNIIILHVTEPLALFRTVVSRCQKVLFRPIPIRAIAEWLMRERDVDEGKAWVLARVSEGSLGAAIRMSHIPFFAMRDRYLSILTGLHGISYEEALEMALEYKKKGKRGDGESGGPEDWAWDLSDMLSIWKSWYRDLVLLKSGCPEGYLINGDFGHKLKNISRNSKIESLIEGFFIVDRTQRELLQARNVDITLEHTVLALKRLAIGTQEPAFSPGL